MISGMGLTQSQRWANKSPAYQHCVDVYEKATGHDGPRSRRSEDDRNGQEPPRPDQGRARRRAANLYMFKDIAEKVGPNLTAKNWQKAVNSYGTIDLAPDKYRVAVQRQVRRARTTSSSSRTTRASAKAGLTGSRSPR